MCVEVVKTSMCGGVGVAVGVDVGGRRQAVYLARDVVAQGSVVICHLCSLRERSCSFCNALQKLPARNPREFHPSNGPPL
jgi:hypothetical protein